MTTLARTASGVLVAVIATGLGAAAIAADAGRPSTPPASATLPADMAQRHQAMVQRRLDDAAARLEIKASQQAAWQAYAATVKDLAESEGMPPRPDADADAATIARQRAERASAFARKLGAIADATAKLQGALTAEQKSVLTELTRNAGMRNAGMRGDMRGGPGGMMMHRSMMDRGTMDHDSMQRAPKGNTPDAGH